MLIGSGERDEILWGYLLGGGLMMVAGRVEMEIGVAAERKPLEEVAPPAVQRHASLQHISGTPFRSRDAISTWRFRQG